MLSAVGGMSSSNALASPIIAAEPTCRYQSPADLIASGLPTIRPAPGHKGKVQAYELHQESRHAQGNIL
jgi:hypothetical protein